MSERQIEQVRRFNRIVTQHVGALEDSYLQRGRPLGQARLLHEVGCDGIDVRVLRERLKLDSGYVSRLLRSSLEAQGLVQTHAPDGRWSGPTCGPEAGGGELLSAPSMMCSLMILRGPS